MPMALRHSALPETLAVAQGAAFMPLETLVVYIADHSGAATVMLLGAIVLLLRGVADDRQACWCLSRGVIVVAVLGLPLCAHAPPKGDGPTVGTFCPGGAGGELLGDDVGG